jgi:hypothetical protein
VDPTSPRTDRATVLAVAAVEYLVAKLVHEGVGHGGACVFTGHTLVAFTTSWCDCDLPDGEVSARRIVKAAGTLANLVVGGLAVAALPWARRRSAATAYATWLTAAVNLLMGLGYVFSDALLGFGDWTAILATLPAIPWLRWVLAAGGAAAYVGVAFVLVALGRWHWSGARARREARELMLLPYLVIGGGLMTLAALRNPLGPEYALTSALATLGGTSALAWLPATVDSSEGSPTWVTRHRGWIAGGVLAAAGALLIFGPGVTLARAVAE